MRRISDLLDDYQEDAIELGQSVPLSAERIKKLTMEKIEPRKKRKLLIWPKLAAAMVAVSMLAVSAAAAEYIWGVRDWLGQVFHDRAAQMQQAYQEKNLEIPLQDRLTEQQLLVLEEMGTVKNQAVTSQGTTITLAAVCSDEYVMHLYFRVQAPEGTVLPEDWAYNFEMSDPEEPSQGKSIKNIHRPAIHMEEGSPLIPMDMVVRALPDADPADNIKDFHMILVTGKTNTDRYGKLNDGEKKTLVLSGLYLCEKAEGNKRYPNILPGEFSFDITNERPSKWIDVDAEGMTYDRQILDETIQAEVEILRISPLSAQWVVKGYPLEFDICMKDGSWATGLTGVAGGIIGQQAKVKGFKTFHLPIDLEQIDYILIDGTEKIYIDP